MRLVAHHTVPGWTSLMAVILLLGGAQLVALGVIGEYIARIFDEAKHRPLYVVRRTAGFTQERSPPPLTGKEFDLRLIGGPKPLVHNRGLSLPLTIPISSVKELSPEELEPLKDALLAHLRSRNAVTRDQVDKNLHVTRGERVPAYSFTLHFLLETRDAVPRPFVKPFTEEEAQRLPSPGNSSPSSPAGIPDLWSFPSEERLDFTPHADSYFLPGTLHVEDCRDCFQRGETGCKVCLGKGVEACPTCLGAGRQPCVYCKGTEKVPCLRCGGEGRLSSGEVGGRSAGCDACAGKGKFSCTHCTGGKLSCPVCGGGGKAPCAKCQGQGKVVCATCGGQKKIISGQAFQASFKPAQARSASLVESAPREVLELALLNTSDAGSFVLASQENFEKQVQEVEVPAPLRKALDELGEREKAHHSPTTRVVKRRLDLAEGSVVRICGYCAGQEFSYWMLPGTNHLIAEKDPLSSFGVSAASSAEDARVAGDWKKALSQAREALSYSPDHAGACDILRTWERKVLQEVLWAGGGGVLVAAVIQFLMDLAVRKGFAQGGNCFLDDWFTVCPGFSWRGNSGGDTDQNPTLFFPGNCSRNGVCGGFPLEHHGGAMGHSMEARSGGRPGCFGSRN
jgi:hypothetical protein